MKNILKRFESNTKTRINIIGQSKSGKTTLIFNLIKDGVFNNQNLEEKDDINTIFSTEILCTAPRQNSVNLFLSFISKTDLIDRLKNVILNFVDESFLKILCENSSNTINNENIKKNKFFTIFNEEMKGNYELSLRLFFNKENLRQVFTHVNFDMLFDELNNVTSDEELDKRDEKIWNKYFDNFTNELRNKYDEWMNRINEYYAQNEYGCEYVNEGNYTSEKFINSDLENIEELLYGTKESCGLMIKRAYIEAPCKENEYSDIVLIDYVNESLDNNLEKEIEKRIGEDYKELFLIVANCNQCFDYFNNIVNGLNKITLDKRMFCIINKFDIYMDELLKNNVEKNNSIIDEIKSKVSNELGINENRIIITERFNDVDKKTLKMLQSNSDFIRLLKLIKRQSINFAKPIKIKSPSKKNIISISLNQERMSVQALMTMLYERYNTHLIEVWGMLIENAEKNQVKNNSKYYFNATRTIIRNRKNDFKGYRYILNKNFNNNVVIDFSLRTGEHNDAKKILKMLINYGYNTIGFDENANKILVTVNGEISKEDKRNLINSIKGRLEESAISYFENAFLMNITNDRFKINNLYSALNTEKNISKRDFYLAFDEIFNTISKNIERYEVLIQ